MSGAVISPCGRYRYLLTRKLRRGPCVTFVMLNPSTADWTHDDPTIRRCLTFAATWGYGELAVVNVMAWRATDPRSLPRNIQEAQGPENDQWLSHACMYSSRVIAAWGARRSRYRDLYSTARDTLVKARASYGMELMCLGYTKGGDPKHPLYLPKSTVPQPFPRD